MHGHQEGSGRRRCCWESRGWRWPRSFSRTREAGSVDVVTDEESAAACPECGVFSTSVKERATTRPRDVPYGSAPIRLVWHKTRWRCREETCSRGSFTECSRRCLHVRGSPRGCGRSAGNASRLTPRVYRLPRTGTGCPGRSRTPRSSRTSTLSSRRRCRRCRSWGSMRPAAASRSGPATRQPAGGGSSPTGG
ncbi:transposase family protein [Nostocoides australiense]